MSLITSVLNAGTNNYQTSAEQANGVATDFFSSGVVGAISNTGGFAPMTGGMALGVSGTSITIGIGIVYVNTTPQSQLSQNLRVRNTATITRAISANASGSTKYDWVYLAVDPTNANVPASDGSNAASIVVSRATNPSTDDGGSTPSFYVLLGIVTVANAFASLSNSNILDKRAQATVASLSTTSGADGWLPSNEVWSYTGNLGYKEFTVQITGDKTGKYSPGMKAKIPRSITPPSQSMLFTRANSHNASRATASVTGLTFTSTYTVEAWVYLNSSPSSDMMVLSRVDNTISNGWYIQILGTSNGGGLALGYASAGSVTQAHTAQAVPLKRWVHIAAVLSSASSKTIALYINGVFQENLAGATAATALTQGTGDLILSNYTGSNQYFDGNMSEVRLWSTARTQQQILDNMGINLVGNETGLVGLWSGNGNFNDTSANANNLTANNGATATSSNVPYGVNEYGKIVGVGLSGGNTTLTLYCGNSCVIPNQTLGAPYYSTQDSPFNFPSSLKRQKYFVPIGAITLPTTATSAAALLGMYCAFTAPPGSDVKVSLLDYNLYNSGGTPVLAFFNDLTTLSATTQLAQFNNSMGSPTTNTYISNSFRMPAAGLTTVRVGTYGTAGTTNFVGVGTLNANPAGLLVEVLD